MTFFHEARFAFENNSRKGEFFQLFAEEFDVEAENHNGDIESHFLPGGQGIIHKFKDGRQILSRDFATDEDGWNVKDMGDLSGRVFDTLRNLSTMTMKWDHSIMVADDVILSIMEVHVPMEVMIVRFISKNEYNEFHPDQSVWMPIPADMTLERYFNRKIAIAGASSSGKTETARTLTANININHVGNAEHATEYARSFILRYGIPDWKLQPFLEEGMLRRETDIGHHNVVISDGPRFLNTIYTRHYFDGKLDPQNVYILHKIYKKSIQALTQYTDIIYCERQTIKQDGCRFQSEDDNDIIDRSIYSLLDDHNVEFIKHNVRGNRSIEDLTKVLFYMND